MVYVKDEGCVQLQQGLADALLVAGASLLLSHGIRGSVCMEAYLKACNPSRMFKLKVKGGRVRGLAAMQTMVEGVVKNLLRRGSWPGIRLEEVGIDLGDAASSCGDGCLPAVEFLAGGRVECPNAILIRDSDAKRAGLKPWWLAAAAAIHYDWRCSPHECF
jgi:hypothetical protein